METPELTCPSKMPQKLREMGLAPSIPPFSADEALILLILAL